MDPLVFGLVAGAAVLHVAWNVLLKTAGDPLRAAAVGMLAASVLIVPAAAIGWLLVGQPPIPPEAVLLGAVSGVLEAAYFSLLAAAYRRGDLSVVYPIARGTAPLLAVAVGIGVLGEQLGTLGFAGVAALLVGLLALQRPWRFLRRAAPGRPGPDPAVGFALATGVMIASYSAVDRVGARLVEPWLYAGMIWAFCTIFLWAGIATVDRVRADPSRGGVPVDVPKAAVGGVMTLAAYLFILVAFSVAPLTAVAPLRESAIVLASGWGTLRLGEAAGAREAALRIAASAVVVLGAVLLALDG
ncbi:MAG TPA: EamA family transporter [Candidatus Limnocylindrales bacterium]|nr:EamA family transporter [Candidatus Limnocylindrales bacterium]